MTKQTDSSVPSKQTKKKTTSESVINKLVFRRLPPNCSPKQLVETFQELPPHDWLYFVPSDPTLGGDSFARAYMALRERDPRALAAAVEAVRARCDGYVFVDPERGGEYPIVVEFAPFQKLPRHCAAFCEGSEPVGKPLKPDARNATIGNDEHFVAFLQEYNAAESGGKGSENTSTTTSSTGPGILESLLSRIEAKRREQQRVLEEESTPLLDYLRTRNEEASPKKKEMHPSKRDKRREREREREEKRKVKSREGFAEGVSGSSSRAAGGKPTRDARMRPATQGPGPEDFPELSPPPGIGAGAARTYNRRLDSEPGAEDDDVVIAKHYSGSSGPSASASAPASADVPASGNAPDGGEKTGLRAEVGSANNTPSPSGSRKAPPDERDPTSIRVLTRPRFIRNANADTSASTAALASGPSAPPATEQPASGGGRQTARSVTIHSNARPDTASGYESASRDDDVLTKQYTAGADSGSQEYASNSASPPFHSPYSERGMGRGGSSSRRADRGIYRPGGGRRGGNSSRPEATSSYDATPDEQSDYTPRGRPYGRGSGYSRGGGGGRSRPYRY